MQFLWELLPGAREARNQVVVGYAWLLAVALWTGVPDVSDTSPLGELVDAVGPIGVGIALGFAAFVLGSISDDFMGRVIASRAPADRAFERPEREDVRFKLGRVKHDFLVRAPDRAGVPSGLWTGQTEESIRAGLERLEDAINRTGTEIALRAGLVLPALIAAAAGARDAWYWCALGLAAGLALVWQASTRRVELGLLVKRSLQIRNANLAPTDVENRA